MYQQETSFRLTSEASLAYAIRQTVAPAVEPVTLVELKSHLRVSIDADDDTIADLGIAARKYYERAIRRQLVTAQYELRMNWWPPDVKFTLPFPPLVSVQSIYYTDTYGNQNLWDPSQYIVDTAREPGNVWLEWNVVWPNIRGYQDSVVVDYTAGYGDNTAQSEEDKLAIKWLTALWYDNREASLETPLSALPNGLADMIRARRIGGYP